VIADIQLIYLGFALYALAVIILLVIHILISRNSDKDKKSILVLPLFIKKLPKARVKKYYRN